MALPIAHHIFTLPINETPQVKDSSSLGKSYQAYHQIDRITHRVERTLNITGYFFLTSYIGSYLRYKLGIAQIAFGFLAAFYQLIVSKNRTEDAKKIFTSYATNGLANIGRSYIEFLGGTLYLLLAYDYMPLGFQNQEVPLAQVLSEDPGSPLEIRGNGFAKTIEKKFLPHLRNIINKIKEKANVLVPLPNGYGFRTPLPTEQHSGVSLTPERYGLIFSKLVETLKNKLF